MPGIGGWGVGYGAAIDAKGEYANGTLALGGPSALVGLAE